VADVGFDEARQILERYPAGILYHPAFDTDSFVFLAHCGEPRFWHGVEQKIMSWDWQSERNDPEWADYTPGIDAGWCYYGDSTSCLDQAFLDDLRAQEPTRRIEMR
jgi:hypothetical protein